MEGREGLEFALLSHPPTTAQTSPNHHSDGSTEYLLVLPIQTGTENVRGAWPSQPQP